MAYTVIVEGDDGPTATVVPTVVDALKLIRRLERDGTEITVATETGWILTSDELESLAKA